MQFGKVQGGALLALGVIFILLQVYLYHSLSASSTSHGPLAGIMGGVFVLAGAIMAFTARRADEPEPKNAVK
jgi:hypothetical protein